MKRLLPALLTVMSLVSGPATVLLADEVYSGIAGYSEKVLPSARDTYVSVPVRAGEAALGELTLEGSPDPDGNQDISISGLGGWSADELADRHAVRLFEGVGEGLRFPVSANNGSTATVNFETAAPSPGPACPPAPSPPPTCRGCARRPRSPPAPPQRREVLWWRVPAFCAGC